MTHPSASGDNAPQAEGDSSNSSPPVDRGSNGTSPRPNVGWDALMEHIINNKVDMGLWVTRIFSILFSIGYIIPLFGNPYNAYYKALMSSAATSALRLHQRVPRVQLNTQCIEDLLLEDSCHYLFYALIFLYVAPVTLVLAPVVLFAAIQCSSYSLILLDCLGQNSWWGARFLISLVEFQTRKVLRLCALCEIMIFPLCIILVFSGRGGLLTPFIYYQFLKMRLSSRRNPYTRNMFHELRSALGNVSTNTSLPGVIRWLINGLLTVTQQMAPNPVQQ